MRLGFKRQPSKEDAAVRTLDLVEKHFPSTLAHNAPFYPEGSRRGDPSLASHQCGEEMVWKTYACPAWTLYNRNEELHEQADLYWKAVLGFENAQRMLGYPIEMAEQHNLITQMTERLGLAAKVYLEIRGDVPNGNPSAAIDNATLITELVKEMNSALDFIKGLVDSVVTISEAALEAAATRRQAELLAQVTKRKAQRDGDLARRDLDMETLALAEMLTNQVTSLKDFTKSINQSTKRLELQG